MNEDYFVENGPEFLYIGGEAPLSGGNLVVTNERIYPMMEWASKLKARVWALEHRFYGHSRPFEYVLKNVLFIQDGPTKLGRLQT